MARAGNLTDILQGRPLIIASNRGPVAFSRDDSDKLVAKKGAGGLVTALSQVMTKASGVWIASAMTPGDREIIRSQGDEHIKVEIEGRDLNLRYLVFPRDSFEQYYNRISNQILWFMQHSLWNLALQPQFTEETHEAWLAYREVNHRFSEAIAEELTGTAADSPVMLHDYHLMLVADGLRKHVADAFCYHFTHSPWSPPEGMRVLPLNIARELLEGMLASDLVGFQSARWAHNFLACCEELLGAKVDYRRRKIVFNDRQTSASVYPISIDVQAVRELARSQEAEIHRRWMEKVTGGRKVIIRVDRMELSKNVVRGFRAYGHFLARYPEWKERVVHLALLYPSRRALPEYRSYEAEVLAVHDQINSTHGTDDWQPIVLVNEDNYVRALACLRYYDVLIVNPIADGMNLVAKEGPAVNETDGVLILSTHAGAASELSHGALSVNPFDISDLAETINIALSMNPEERRDRASLLRQVVEHNNPSKWVWHQLRDIKRMSAKTRSK